MNNTAKNMSHRGTGLKGLDFVKSLQIWKGTADFDLSIMRALMKELGNPQDKIKSIHVAGTNGKGSVSVSIASILGAAGYSVGLNISPHLVKLNERIVIDGKSVSDDLLNEYGELLRLACIKINQKPSFHEALTALAFMIFEGLKLDYAVIEVGLGGRLDSTNVISKPEICVITTIDFDHTDILGDTLEKIATEKAGIIKKGTKVIIGDLPTEAKIVVEEKTKYLGCTLIQYGIDFTTDHDRDLVNYNSKNNFNYTFTPGLKGKHQAHNLALAARVGEELKIKKESIIKGLANVNWSGRLENHKEEDITITFDCAHNPHGVRALAEFLKESSRRVSLVFGVLNSKSWKEMIKTLQPYVSEWILLKPDSDRAVRLEEIEEYLKENSIGKVYIRDSKYELVSSEIIQGKYGEDVLVAGSMYMVGKLRSLIIKEEKDLWKKNI